jgi:hypothetical protein
VRVIGIYLAVYFALIVAAGVVSWEAGLFAEFPPPYVALGLLVAVGLGLLLAAVSLPSRTRLRP